MSNLIDTRAMENAVRSEVTSAIVNSKANVCPFAIRLAWHASGTYYKDAKDDEPSGGSNGATMRFEPEISDGANAGLKMMQNILRPVKERFPHLSYADIWTFGGCQAIKLMGGPDIPFEFGRTDDSDGAKCPMNGRLPDAALGADHLREIFYRMGFDDKDIVALSGAVSAYLCSAYSIYSIYSIYANRMWKFSNNQIHDMFSLYFLLVLF
jgi:catalase (peroxidase I)